MAKLLYGMLISLDGYTEDGHGEFGWGAPENEEVHSYVNELASPVGTYLYGRRMYEMIVCPIIVGGGKRFLPDGIRLDVELFEVRRFGNGVVVLRYSVRR